MTTIGVLGAGSHSSGNHGPALRALKEQQPDDLRLAAICDLDAERAGTYCERFGLERVCQDVDEMLDAEALDGLVLVTPVELTEELAVRLLPRGIPLMIEKPPGVDSDACRRIMAVAAETGTPHMVSLNRRFSPAVSEARRWLDASAGDRPPQLAIARMLRHNRTEPEFRVWTGIHLIDAALSIMGRPTHVSAGNIPAQHEDVFLSHATVSTERGVVQYIISPAVGTVEETYEFQGADYDVAVDAWGCATRVHDSAELVVDWEAPADSEPAWRNGTVGEMQAFIEALRGEREFSPTLEDALAAMLVAEAIVAGGETTISL